MDTMCTMSVLSLARSNFGELCPNPRSRTWTGSLKLTPGIPDWLLPLPSSWLLFLLSALVASHEKLQPSIWRASEHQKILCNVKTLWETMIWKENLWKNFLLCFAAIVRPMIIDCYKKRFSNGNMLILFLREFEWPSCDYLPLSRQIGGLDAVVSWVLSRYPSHRANSVSTSLSEPMTVVNKRAVEMNSEMKTAQTDRYA